ncbi:MAG: hypothetical protein WCX97_05145 [Candidatus Magasanikbacteria bacterium]
MIFESQSKNKTILLIVSLVILIIGISILAYSLVIFQEGNPWPQLKGVVQLNFAGQDMVKLSVEDNKYMTKSKNGAEVIEEYMKDKGYDFTEQMGSGYLFQSSTGESFVVTHRYYSRFYSLWKITENTNTDNNLWTTTTTNNGIAFQYPKEILAKYISMVEWPPVISINNDQHEFVCEETPAESSLADRTTRRLVDDRVYCLSASSEGAAGSVYTDYNYSTVRNGNIININFTLQFPRCDNYDEYQQTECQKERESFDVDGVVDRITQSIDIN